MTEMVDISCNNSYIFAIGIFTDGSHSILRYSLDAPRRRFSMDQGEKEFAMSKQLLDKLENKVFSAVDTIELLRSEINDLKEERKTLENKLQELIEKMGNLDNSGLERQMDGPAESEEQAPTSSMGMDEPPDSDWRAPDSSMGMEALRDSKEQEPTSPEGMDELPDSKEQNPSSSFGPAIQSYKDQKSDY